MTARRLRPISRLISWVRPPIRPFTDSRSDLVLVARGSIAYSLVTQPSPDPFRQRGTPGLTLAATSTRVAPNSTSTDPSACSSQPRVNRTARSSSGDRPSARLEAVDSLGALPECALVVEAVPESLELKREVFGELSDSQPSSTLFATNTSSIDIDDIAEAVRYLAGPESSWVTGAVLPVEGGSHLRRAADLEILARSICGDDSIDRALQGRLPAVE